PLRALMKLLTLLLCSLFLAPSQLARAEENSAARKIFGEKQESVVWLSAVAKISYSSDGARDSGINIPDREQKTESLGTIIDPSGRAGTALSSLDPSRDVSGREIRTRKGMIKIDANAVLKEVKIILADGTEIPAELVMRDADLDLAFVKPKAGAKEA